MQRKAMLLLEARELIDLSRLAQLLESLESYFELLAISSIFQRSDFGAKQSRFSRKIKLVTAKSLSVAISIQTTESAEELIERISLIQAQRNQSLAHGSLHLFLLFYSHHVFMLPSVHLPYPGWLERPDWILASAEIWPKFVHPILNEPLDILARKRKIKVSDYFFAQGKELLKRDKPATT